MEDISIIIIIPILQIRKLRLVGDLIFIFPRTTPTSSQASPSSWTNHERQSNQIQYLSNLIYLLLNKPRNQGAKVNPGF